MNHSWRRSERRSTTSTTSVNTPLPHPQTITNVRLHVWWYIIIIVNRLVQLGSRWKCNYTPLNLHFHFCVCVSIFKFALEFEKSLPVKTVKNGQQQRKNNNSEKDNDCAKDNDCKRARTVKRTTTVKRTRTVKKDKNSEKRQRKWKRTKVNTEND